MLITRPFYPSNGGDKVRAKFIYDAFKSGGHSVTIISFYKNSDDRLALTDYLSEDDRIVWIKWSVFESLLGLLYFMFSRWPLQIGIFYSTRYRRALRYHSSCAEVIYCHLARPFGMVSVKDRNKVILDLTDSLALAYSRQSLDFSLKSIFFKFEQSRFQYFERKMLDTVPSIWLISEFDKQFILESKSSVVADLKVIRNGGNEKPGSNVRTNPLSNRLLFIGNFDTLPNINALNFISLILSETEDNYELYISGKNGKKFQDESTNIYYIDYDLLWDSGLDFYVGLTPMFYGAGLQNKTLDYMRIGLPTLSTSIGANGFTALQGSPIHICDDVSSFIRGLEKLRNPKIYLDSCAASLEFFNRNFSTNEIFNVVNDELIKMISPAGVQFCEDENSVD